MVGSPPPLEIKQVFSRESTKEGLHKKKGRISPEEKSFSFLQTPGSTKGGNTKKDIPPNTNIFFGKKGEAPMGVFPTPNLGNFPKG